MRQVLSSVSFADIVVAVLGDDQDERAIYFPSYEQVSHLQACSVQDLDGGKCAA